MDHTNCLQVAIKSIQYKGESQGENMSGENNDGQKGL
jgi:hypothetical protein